MGPVRFVILGAGAVGGTVGGLLHDSGHEVVLVARGAHAAAMRAEGLRLATPDRVITVRTEVVDDPAALKLRDDDVLVVTTKTQDTTALLATVAGLSVDGRSAVAALPVFCVQNGVANERIAARRFADVHGVVVMLPAVLLEPGRVEAQGAPYSGLLDVGRWPHGTTDVDEKLATALTASGFVSRATPDVMRWKYAKLLRNLGNAIEALCGHDLDADDMAVVRDLDRMLRVEAEACLAAAGIDWATDEEWVERRGEQVQHAPVEGRARSGGSSWQSLARGLGSIEADYLNGEVALLGRQYDVPTPGNVALQRLANDAARRGARPGGTSVRDVVAAIDIEKGSIRG
jgi:2-dehydropantoate 2-reductase